MKLTWPILIFAGSLIFRFACYAKASTTSVFFDPLYISAIRDHFWDYITYNGIKPPLNFVIHKLLMWLNTEAFNPFLIFVFIFDSLGLALLYNTFKKISVSPLISIPLLGLLSMTLVPFEFNRLGSHYDAYTFPLVCFFVFSVTNWSKNKTVKHAFVSGVASSLLILQNPVYPPIVLLIAISTILLIFRSRVSNWKSQFVCMLIAPTISLGLLLAKTYATHGVLSTSNLSGMSQVGLVYSHNDWDPVKVREIAVKANMPDWYLWCFDNSVPYKDTSGVIDPIWVAFSKAAGICFDWPKDKEQSWPFDFTNLKIKMQELGLSDHYASKIDEDIYDMRERKYRMSGVAPEYSPRWFGIYGQESSKIFKYWIKHHPYDYYNGIVAHQFKLFKTGVTTLMTFEFLNDSGYSRKAVDLVSEIGIYFNTLFIRLLWVLPILSVLFFIYVFINRDFARNRLGFTNDDFFLQAIWSLTSIVLLVIFCCAIATENNRHLRQLTVYLYLTLGWCLQLFWNLVKVAFKKV